MGSVSLYDFIDFVASLSEIERILARERWGDQIRVWNGIEDCGMRI